LKVQLQCFPCFLKQAMIAASQLSDDPRLSKQFIDLSLGPVRWLDWDLGSHFDFRLSTFDFRLSTFELG
jgi:hypothetical protein